MKKSDIRKILRTYSVRDGEFEPIENSSNRYKSNLVNGYMITISEETTRLKKTGRILVEHTRTNGRKTFNDIWEDTGNGLEFVYRNPAKFPPSDKYVIEDLTKSNQELEKENDLLRQKGRKLREQLKEKDVVPSGVDVVSQGLEDSVQKLIKKTEELSSENQALKAQISQKKKVGRPEKPKEELQKQIDQMQELLNVGKKEEEICADMRISRATYFRIKKKLQR